MLQFVARAFLDLLIPVGFSDDDRGLRGEPTRNCTAYVSAGVRPAVTSDSPERSDASGDIPDRADASGDRPDRPRVGALVAELEVKRHVRTALVVGVAFALVVFVLFAYLPGTDESLLFWAGLTFVLASAVAGLVGTVLVGRAAYRRTLEVDGIEPGRRSATTLALVFGLAGWILVPVAATLVFDRPNEGFRLAVALVTSGFVVVVVGSLGLKLVAALSLTHEWRPLDAALASVGYTTLVAVPAVGCPTGGFCLGTPDHVVTASVGLDATAVSPAYALTTVGGAVVVGAALGFRGATPTNGFLPGAVAALSTLPVVAAAAGDPSVVRSTALYLPMVLGLVGAVGCALALVLRRRAQEGDRMNVQS